MAESMAAPEPLEPEPDSQAAAPDSSVEEPVEEERDVRLFPNAPSVRQVEFAPIAPFDEPRRQNSMDLILNVEVQATVELGRANLQVRDVLELGPGSVVELEKLAGEPVDVLVNNRPFARGEVVVIDENFGVRVTEIISPTERISSLG